MRTLMKGGRVIAASDDRLVPRAQHLAALPGRPATGPVTAS